MVSIFNPKHKRAMFTRTLELGKLLSTLPRVLSPNVRNPLSAIARHANIEMLVE